MKGYRQLTLIALSSLLNVCPSHAELISGQPEPGKDTLYFSPRRVDIDGDGAVDFELINRSITNGFSATSYVTAEPLRSNLMLSTPRGARRFTANDRKNLAISLGDSTWENFQVSIAYYRKATEARPNAQVWDGGLKGYLSVLIEKADGYHPGWIELGFEDTWHEQPRVSTSPRLVGWKYDTEPISINPRHLLPKFHEFTPIKEYEQILYIEGLIEGHRYTVQWNSRLSLTDWETVKEFTATGRSGGATLREPKAQHARFFRIRHDWPSASPE